MKYEELFWAIIYVLSFMQGTMIARSTYFVDDEAPGLELECGMKQFSDDDLAQDECPESEDQSVASEGEPDIIFPFLLR